jgi:hypothetical protein
VEGIDKNLWKYDYWSPPLANLFTRSMLGNWNKENFIVVLLSIVSSNFMAVHSDVLQRSYVGRWVLISIGVRDALFVHRPRG